MLPCAITSLQYAQRSLKWRQSLLISASDGCLSKIARSERRIMFLANDGVKFAGIAVAYNYYLMVPRAHREAGGEAEVIVRTAIACARFLEGEAPAEPSPASKTRLGRSLAL